MEKKLCKPFYLAIASHFEGEKDFGPSMVEPCNNLSLEQIVKDYSRGIMHPTLQGMYDDGDDVPEFVDELRDLTDLQANPQSATRPASRPAQTDEELSDEEGSKDGTGAEGAGGGKGAGEPANGSPAKKD